jgi:hypothetical protein
MSGMGIYYDSGMSTLRAYAAWEKARRQRECERLSNLVSTVPVADSVVQEVAQLNPDDFALVMRSHPGAALNRKAESLWSMLRVFRTACRDLKADIRDYAAYDHRQRQELDRIAGAVQKDMFAACAAAESVIQHAHRVRQLVPEAEYKARCSSVFDVPQQSFIKQLRNNLVHVGFIEADWLVRYHFGTEDKRATPKESAFQFSRAELLAGEFTGEARAYVEKMGEKIDVEVLFEDYGKRVEEFYAWLEQRIEWHLPQELADYRRCADEYQRTSGRAVYRLFLNTWINWKVDPYAHLQDYLTTEQMREVGHMPVRSLEQVNRIIELADKDRIVDEELRGLIYRLFGVNC